MKEKDRRSLELLAVVAVVNLVLVFPVGAFCKVMAGVYPHIFGDDMAVFPEVAFVFHTYWWPWLLFTASCLCIIGAFLGVKARTLFISAITILLIDIFCLAATLLIIASLFARPMWTLM